MADSNVGEIWKAVVGYEGIYEVSNVGRVRSYNQFHKSKPRPHLLTPKQEKDGYWFITLSKNRTVKTFRVSRLMLAAFVGPPPTPKHQAAHNNGVLTDNRIENLRWATQIENFADKVLHGTHSRGEKNSNSKLSNAQTLEIFAMKDSGRMRKEIAKQYGVTASVISFIMNGRIRSSVTGLPRLG